ncbi:hypothetical protein QLX08_011624 [Tetragonisca angustula]|uniref:Uncharacterized protein n=1 Tax=Tetragonisca angustula TaxID=166442 RepID=A0AAW0Z825_9HYME
MDDFALMTHIVMVAKSLFGELAALREEVLYRRPQEPSPKRPITDSPMQGNAQNSERYGAHQAASSHKKMIKYINPKEA